MKKETIAVATKAGRKTKELKTWEQVSEYQTRGWDITMKNNKEEKKMKVNYRIISTTGKILIDTTVEINSNELQELKSELEEMVDDIVGADRYEIVSVKEGNKMKKMNGHEKIAAKNIQGAFNWLVGGWYNCYQDGYEEDIPTLEEAKEEVYYGAMNNLYRGGSESCEKAPKEMRFAGEEFCRAYVEKLFAEDGDAEELWGNETAEENKEDTEMENKREMLNNMTVKELRAEAKAQGIEGMSRAKKDELIAALMFHNYGQPDPEFTVEISKVKMYAFTGMYIGEFDAEVKDGKILVYTESKGELMFDLETGKEITDEAKARYANKVERA